MAARWAGYRWKEFHELEGEEQSFLVAAYRVANQIESLVSHEQMRDAKAKAQQARPSSRPGRRR